MKTCESAVISILTTKLDGCQWCWADSHSRQWAEVNWHASYSCGFEDALGIHHSMIESFLRKGSMQSAHDGWFWYPYLMGYRDAQRRAWED